MIKFLYKKLICKLPYVREIKRQCDEWNVMLAFPPGHFYSPIFDKRSYVKQKDFKFSIKGIKFKHKEQKELMRIFNSYTEDFNFPIQKQAGFRYYSNNEFYTGYDALTLFCFLKHFQPKRIIEVGSGFSSALILDIIDSLKLNIEMKFIEPYPNRLLQLLKPNERNLLIEEKVQNIELKIFEKLEAEDFLIIDTSHVSKSFGDVNHIFFNILPVIKRGVHVHFHDIFYPFEYPDKWVFEENRSWNEIYLLRAFLMYNNTFEIEFFNHYLEQAFNSENNYFFDQVSKPEGNSVGSIWLKKS